MRRFAAVLLLACPCLLAHDTAALKFAGTWEARFKDKVICNMRINAGDPISGETFLCFINADENGDLKEPAPDSANQPAKYSPMLNMKVHDDTLRFEDQDGDDVLRFEMKLVGDGEADLKILNSPVPVKPIHFRRK